MYDFVTLLIIDDLPSPRLLVGNRVTRLFFHVAHTLAVQEEELEVHAPGPCFVHLACPLNLKHHPCSYRLLFAGFGAAACSPWTSADAISSATHSLTGRLA